MIVYVLALAPAYQPQILIGVFTSIERAQQAVATRYAWKPGEFQSAWAADPLFPEIVACWDDWQITRWTVDAAR